VSDFVVPLSIPDVATAIEEAHADRHAAGQRLFQFLVDVDEVDLREEAIQAQLFDSDAAFENNGTRSPGNGSGVRSVSGTGRSDAPGW
jgi:hypothetical protein